MKYDFDECLRFVKHKVGASLLPYQAQMLKAFCEGKEVRTARCVGRSYVAQLFGRYVASLYDKNDYNKEPDVIFTYECAVELGVIDSDFIQRERKRLPDEVFKREYLCE